MRKKACYLIIFLLITSPGVKAQTDAHDVARLLESLFARIIDRYDTNERIRLNDSVQLLIDSYVTSDSVFTHRFGIRNLGQVLSPDNRFKIINWNLILPNGTNKYFCYFIVRQADNANNKVYKLTGLHSEDQVRTDTIYSVNNWYGSLYYAIKPFKIKRQTSYILLGIDLSSGMTNRKIIEVLNLNDDGTIIFGKKCFSLNNKLKFREVLEYSSEGVVSLKFNNDKTIVFNHLASSSERDKNDSDSYGADVFDAYNYKKGIWYFESNVDFRRNQR
jgi:hypothetical protein